jgi:flagellar hook-associated protein 2
MSTIQLPGLLTGIDTSTLISQLMAVESRTLNLYKERQTALEEKKDAVSTLKSNLETLKTSVGALSDAGKLRAFKVASSDTDILTAEVSSDAFEGNHTVVVHQLANAERWVHTNGKEYAEDYVGDGNPGTFIYSYNHKETILTTTATTTLQDLVGLINNDPNNPGVTANLLYYNDAYHLVLNGNDPGTDYEISINSSNTEVWENKNAFTKKVDGEQATLDTKIVDLEQFTGNLDGGEQIQITGTDSGGNPIAQVNLTVTGNTRLEHLIAEINDAFDGIAKAVLKNGKIVLTADASGESDLSISLAYNDGNSSSNLTLPYEEDDWNISQGGVTVAQHLADFESGDFTRTQPAQDCQFKVDGYPTGEEEWFSRSSNTVDDVIHGVTLHLHDTGTVQVNLTRDVESVKEKMQSLVDSYNAVISYIQENTTYDATNKTAGVLMGDYIVSTVKSQLLTPLIARTSGFIVDIDSFLTPAQIGLQLDRDGTLSLDSDTFDKAVAKNYTGVLAIIGAAKTGSSDNNTIKFYGASSKYTTAGAYNVQVTVDQDGNIAAGIKLSTESEYRSATLSGNIITGDSSFDEKGNPIYPENGLQLSVNLSDLSPNHTYTATIRVKQGFAGAMEDTLDKMLKLTTGSIQIDEDYVTNSIEQLQDRIDAEEERLTKEQERLVARFARLESTLALLQQQMNALGISSSSS